jgi:hypothetical protein
MATVDRSVGASFPSLPLSLSKLEPHGACPSCVANVAGLPPYHYTVTTVVLCIIAWDICTCTLLSTVRLSSESATCDPWHTVLFWKKMIWRYWCQSALHSSHCPGWRLRQVETWSLRLRVSDLDINALPQLLILQPSCICFLCPSPLRMTCLPCTSRKLLGTGHELGTSGHALGWAVAPPTCSTPRPTPDSNKCSILSKDANV